MSKEFDKSDPLEAIERTLAGFGPAPPRIERDRLMFLAGRASAERRRPSRRDGALAVANRWLWPAATGMLGATAAALAMALVLRQEPRVLIVEREMPVSVRAAAPQQIASAAVDFNAATALRREPAASRVPAENYLRTREVALRMGLDAIGSQQTVPGLSAPPTYGELLWGLMGSQQPSDGGTERREKLFNM